VTPKRRLSAGIAAILARPWRGNGPSQHHFTVANGKKLTAVAGAESHGAFDRLAAVLAARHSRVLLSGVTLGLALRSELATLLAPLLDLAVVASGYLSRRYLSTGLLT
jgi:hypothetical protein